jgi:mannose-1-phosphate guanylyltransferase/mannose-6-phosphate isomerase
MLPAKTTKLIPVVMCGGTGSRLWPLSRSEFPKQFLSLNDSGITLFQETIQRIVAIDPTIQEVIVITNEAHRFFVLDQLSLFPSIKARLILEPTPKNTAAALSLAALEALNFASSSEINDDFVLCVLPSDQIMTNVLGFKNAIEKSLLEFINGLDINLISIFGIKPSSPETGFGYIELEPDSNAVKHFVEKPSLKTAQSYIDAGNFYWNSGMFLMRPITWLNALNKFRPDIYSTVHKAWDMREVDDVDGNIFIRPSIENFLEVPSESIDYAVIENCKNSEFNVKMVLLDSGWNDLGSWNSVWQTNQKDDDGNVLFGDAVTIKVANSLIKSSHRLVGAVGVSDLVIIETSDCVLVADRNQSQDIKLLIEKLERNSRPEKNLHRKVYRPWGWYDNLDEGSNFKVKRINVKPGESISLQMHHHRSEHWVVVKGVAEILNGVSKLTLIENQGTYIPVGQVHRLKNAGEGPLEIIEVQSGGYLGEDDIVRFEDRYGRI